MSKGYFLLIIHLFVYLHAGGQSQNNVWAFGKNVGLDFNSVNPVVVNNQIHSREGCASICDKFGNLLFYSNGNDVWNKNHQVMPNGNGLLGNGMVQIMF